MKTSKLSKVLVMMLAFLMVFGGVFISNLLINTPIYAWSKAGEADIPYDEVRTGGGQLVYYHHNDGVWYKMFQDAKVVDENTGTKVVIDMDMYLGGQDRQLNGANLELSGTEAFGFCVNPTLASGDKEINVRHRYLATEKAADTGYVVTPVASDKDNTTVPSEPTVLDAAVWYNTEGSGVGNYNNTSGRTKWSYTWGQDLYDAFAKIMYYGYPVNANKYDCDEETLIQSTQKAIYFIALFGKNPDGWDSSVNTIAGLTGADNTIFQELKKIAIDENNEYDYPDNLQMYVYYSDGSQGSGSNSKAQNMIGISVASAEPGIKNTTAKANEKTGTVGIEKGKTATITDEIELQNLEEGVTYSVKSYLYKDDEEIDTVEEKNITSETTSPITVKFSKEVSEAGEYKIKTELLDASGAVIATHNEKFDKDTETVTIRIAGTLKTTVKGASSSNPYTIAAGADGTVTTDVVDTIDYEDLTGGATYTVSGTLIRIDDDFEVATVSEEKEADSSGSGSWEITFSGVQLEAGKSYVVYEEAINTADETDTAEHKDKTDKAQTIVVTDPTSIKVTKAWDDELDDSRRPTSVKVRLINATSGAVVGDTVELNADNEWTHTFTGLAATDSDGKEIEYTVEEDQVPYYAAMVSGDASSGFTLTNIHRPWYPELPNTPGSEEFGQFSVKKTVGVGVDASKAYKITASFTYPTGNTSEYTIELKSTDSAFVFDSIPAGTKVVISEEKGDYTMNCTINGEAETSFTVGDQDDIAVVVSNVKPGSGSSPSTGDRTNILIWILILLAAVLLGVIAVRVKNKKA